MENASSPICLSLHPSGQRTAAVREQHRRRRRRSLPPSRFSSQRRNKP